MAVKNRAVDVDGEAFGPGGLDRGDGFLEAAFHADRFVVVFLDAVEMDGEEQIGRRLEQVQLLFQKQRIGAQRHEFLARDDAFDDLADLLVDQRLAARDCDHGRAAFVHRIEAFRNRKPFVEDGVGIVDLAAAGARQVAAEQRFEHEHERVALAPGETLPQHVSADFHFLSQRYAQGSVLVVIVFRPFSRHSPDGSQYEPKSVPTGEF
jgi:hypothetical protein